MKKKKIMPKKIRFRQELFWDVDPKTIDSKKHARYIIERILDFGDTKEVAWLAHQYPAQSIRRVMTLPRTQIHRKSKNLWSPVFQKKKR